MGEVVVGRVMKAAGQGGVQILVLLILTLRGDLLSLPSSLSFPQSPSSPTPSLPSLTPPPFLLLPPFPSSPFPFLPLPSFLSPTLPPSVLPSSYPSILLIPSLSLLLSLPPSNPPSLPLPLSPSLLPSTFLYLLSVSLAMAVSLHGSGDLPGDPGGERPATLFSSTASMRMSRRERRERWTLSFFSCCCTDTKPRICTRGTLSSCEGGCKECG